MSLYIVHHNREVDIEGYLLGYLYSSLMLFRYISENIFFEVFDKYLWLLVENLFLILPLFISIHSVVSVFLLITLLLNVALVLSVYAFYTVYSSDFN